MTSFLGMLALLSIVGGYAIGGVIPSSGPLSGGTMVTITGSNLGNGSDITNVTICGVTASSIISQSATQVVVRTGSTGVPVSAGVITVYSANYGVTTVSNAFTYNPAGVILAEQLVWGTVSNMPAVRDALSAASAGGKIFAMGGNGAGSVPQSTAWAYDPSLPGLGWQSVSNMPTTRRYQSAVSLGTKVYVLAGDPYASTVWVYDTTQPGLGWGSVSNMPAGRNSMGSTVATGKIFALGGETTGIGLTNAWVYDTAQPGLGWGSISNLPEGSCVHAAVTVSGKVYLIKASSIPVPSAVWVYDPAQPGLGWGSVSNLPAARYWHGAAVLNNKIYVIGGYDETGAFTSTVWVYDPAQPALGWVSASSLPSKLVAFGTTTLDNKIYVMGGNNSGARSSTAYVGTVVSGVSPAFGPMSGGT